MPDDKNFNDDLERINKPSVSEGTERTDGTHDKEGSNEELLEEVRNSTNLIKVLSQDLVIISVDKIRLAYSEHIEARNAKGIWVAPVGLFSTLLLSLLTTTFTDSFGIQGSTWKAFFMLACLVTAIWAVLSIIDAFKAQPIDDVDSFIQKITVDKNHR